MKKNKVTTKVITIIGSVIIFLLLLPLLIKIVPEIYRFIKNENYAQLEAYLQSFGVWGAFLAVAIQMLQIFSVVVPAPVIWISVGVVYGTFWGVLICVTGILLGNFIVFELARKFKIRRDDKFSKGYMKFLSGIKNPNLMIALMVMIPGFPNGIVPYIGASTNLTTRKFLLLVGIASIPSILLTTGIGDLFISGNRLSAVIAFIVLVVAGIAVMLFKNKIITFVKRFDDKQK
ncbi:MAG: VTT domain-containing protein [Oscillospiraceae bacterium]